MKVITLPVGPLAANCYLLTSAGGGCAVIDPGAEATRIAREIADGGLIPRMILLTHGHHDHFGGVKQLLGRFPQIPVYIGAEDQELLADPLKSYAAIRHRDLKDFTIETAQSLATGDVLALDELTIHTLHTPGHTRGGVVYLCGDALLTGDTLFLKDCGNCDLYGGSFQAMKDSLKRLAQLPGDYAVYPGHGPATTLAFEREHNPYMPKRQKEGSQ